MKVWVFVEGQSDKTALETLWSGWRTSLGKRGHGIAVIPMSDKARFLHRIGHRAAEKLVGSCEDVVVGLPDLYPNRPYDGTEFKHDDLSQLQSVQKTQVRNALRKVFKKTDEATESMLVRFYPSALKHDLEVLLLAAKRELRAYLGTRDQLGGLRQLVEDQNQDKPPKRVVEELFRTKSNKKRAYYATVDAAGVLRQVADMRTIVFGDNGQVQCPVFKGMLDWVGVRTGLPAYS